MSKNNHPKEEKCKKLVNQQCRIPNGNKNDNSELRKVRNRKIKNPNSKDPKGENSERQKSER